MSLSAITLDHILTLLSSEDVPTVEELLTLQPTGDSCLPGIYIGVTITDLSIHAGPPLITWVQLLLQAEVSNTAAIAIWTQRIATQREPKGIAASTTISSTRRTVVASSTSSSSPRRNFC